MGSRGYALAIVITCRVKRVDCVCDWHHRHQRISRSVSIVLTSLSLAGTCAFSGVYVYVRSDYAKWHSDDSRALFKVAGVHGQSPCVLPRMNLESSCISEIVSRDRFSARITENKSRLLLAYVTDRYANRLLRILRSCCLSFFFFFSSQTRLAAVKRKQGPQARDVCTNN